MFVYYDTIDANLRFEILSSLRWGCNGKYFLKYLGVVEVKVRI